MKLIFLSFCCVFIAVAQASAQVVSLSSGVCGQKTFASNGYQFRYQGHTLVLASADYVVDSSGACHLGGGNTLRLLKSDWGAGLALFESPSASAPDIQWGTPQLMKKVMFAPGQGSGLIQANKSDRHQFPQQKDVLEIARFCLGPSAVGAPLFDYDHGDQVVGFISSQFIDFVPGEVAKIMRLKDYNWAGIDCESGPFIALSALNVKAWVDQTLAQIPARGSVSPLLSLDAQAQTQNIQKINWGPLSLTENCPTSVGGGQGSNYPIGGGDPFGIGGVSSNTSPCKFSVALNGSVVPVSVAGPYAAFMQQMVDLLKQNKTVEVYLGYKRTNGVLVSTGFISIGDFFKKLLVGDLQFVLMVDGQKDQSALSPLQAQARHFRLVLQSYPFDSPDHSFRNRGYLIALMLEGPQAGQVTHQDLEGLKQESPWLEYDTMIDGLANLVDGVKP